MPINIFQKIFKIKKSDAKKEIAKQEKSKYEGELLFKRDISLYKNQTILPGLLIQLSAFTMPPCGKERMFYGGQHRGKDFKGRDMYIYGSQLSELDLAVWSVFFKKAYKLPLGDQFNMKIAEILSEMTQIKNVAPRKDVKVTGSKKTSAIGGSNYKQVEKSIEALLSFKIDIVDEDGAKDSFQLLKKYQVEKGGYAYSLDPRIKKYYDERYTFINLAEKSKLSSPLARWLYIYIKGLRFSHGYRYTCKLDDFKVRAGIASSDKVFRQRLKETFSSLEMSGIAENFRIEKSKFTKEWIFSFYVLGDGEQLNLFK